MYFPRRMAFVMVALLVLLNLWNTFRYTFLITNCKQILLPWGIFGENIIAQLNDDLSNNYIFNPLGCDYTTCRSHGYFVFLQ